MKKYKSILKQTNFTLEIQKSKFISYIKSVNSSEEANKFIDEIKKQHKDARHNTFAYIIDNEKEITEKYSDDKEPKGTAGPPILDIIKRMEIKNVVIVVTRYFGGILLGASGLIRAYSNAAKLVVEKAGICDMVPFLKIKISINYEDHGKIRNYFLNNNICLYKENFFEKVNLYVYLKEEDYDKIKQDIKDITRDKQEVEEIDCVYLPVIDGNVVI